MMRIGGLIDHLGGETVAAPADRVLAWDRILAWAEHRPHRILGYNPWKLGAHVVRTSLRHRVTGPAAEMSFFAMLTLVPLTVAVGAALGQIQRFVGPEKIARGQDAAISLVRVVISPKLTDGVVDPFVRAQLSQRKGGAAIGGLLLTWWLAGRLFAATSRALDTAYHDRHQRLSITQRLIALGFAFVSVVVVVLTLGIMVDAPFLDEQHDLALGSGAPTGVVVNYAQVVLIGRAVGAVVATVLWTYFSSIAILVGNELNAELARSRGPAH
jgi:membrane protein